MPLILPLSEGESCADVCSAVRAIDAAYALCQVTPEGMLESSFTASA